MSRSQLQMFPRPCLLLYVVLVSGAGLTVLQSIQSQFYPPPGSPPHLLLFDQASLPSDPVKLHASLALLAPLLRADSKFSNHCHHHRHHRHRHHRHRHRHRQQQHNIH